MRGVSTGSSSGCPYDKSQGSATPSDSWHPDVYQDDSIQSESWTSYYKVELEAVAHRLVDLSQSEGECQEYVEQRKRSTSAWVAVCDDGHSHYWD
jgi:hypothetical protein